MWKRTVCTKDCPDTCGLLAKVEDGRVVAVKGDPDHPFTNGFICRKGASFPAHVHSPDRITTPLRRTGPKGSGRFAPISWDEALDEIAARIRAVTAESGPEAILPYSYAGHMGLIHRHAGHAFFNKLGASALKYTICSNAAGAGLKVSLGSGPGADLPESAKSDLILIWGGNIRTTNIHAWPFFAAARRNGARLVVIDPYRNDTARAADEHVMLRPGTDAALALSMMHVLIAEELIDRDYIARMTVGYDRLKGRAAEYPPERAARICGIEPERIVRLARQYGSARAPFIRGGMGPARQLAGAMAMRTIALLPALVGAFEKPGGGFSRSVGGGISDLSCLTRPDLRPAGTREVNMVELGDALTRLDDPPVRLLYVYLSNPAAVAPQSRRVMAGLLREDLFTVVHEMFMTDTARHADVILPGASFMEMADLYRAYGHNYIQAAEPVIPPVGQCRTSLDIFQSLAARLGFDDEVFSLTEKDFMARLLADDTSGALDGVDLSPLAEGRPVRLNIPASPYAKGFNTPSGKVEFYSEAMAARGLDPLPDGTPVRDPDGARYPLECITPPHRLLLNSAFNEVAELREMMGPPTVKIHPETAAARDIGPGALVRVFNGRGECRLYAELTDDTRPDLLVIEGLRWPGLTPGGGANQLTSQRLTDMGETCAFHCNLVEVELA
ncbi:molybdopterin-dependent oxidoreductase [Pseudodesulfovibrio sp.]|uniref:molybdopterin-containing oxidoreductase family protein n=1 Tax=Pseudodesulfovibrio sp. TaxID=2035812 RepID=UPI002630E5B5|nr:molybdopterin-dependent oxidoreductase [Pseudodesulfovibrio sp.]MDD3313801.1 molybdopterin-dependent oxidoreductase [Pseudodesulfovibrio sp.]